MEPMNSDDYAIVIGISDYAELPKLEGATKDAEAFAKWLTASDGGRLPKQNVTLITNRYATMSGVWEEFFRLIDVKERISRRLYIYCAGHAYANSKEQIALLTVDASLKLPDHSIDLRGYADSFDENGSFEEIILFTDCTRVPMYKASPANPPWSETKKIERQVQNFSYFYAFGTITEQQSYKSTFATEGVHGFFTQALLDALNGSAAVNGRVKASDLEEYITERVAEIGTAHGIKTIRPEFYSGGSHPIILVDHVAHDFTQPLNEETKFETNDALAASYMERVTALVLEQSGVTASPTPNAQNLLTASVGLLPLKISKKDVLSVSTVFLAALQWGLDETPSVRPSREIVNLAQGVVAANRKGYEKLIASYFKETPSGLALEGNVSDLPDFRVSDTLSEALKQAVVEAEDGPFLSESSILQAVLLYIDSGEALKNQLQGRLQKLGLSAKELASNFEVAQTSNEDENWQRGYANDGVDATKPDSDKLNINEQARIFAELIMNPHVEPPLSIGLFGNWGSGKSFFMQRIEAEIDDLTGTPGRNSSVVQVKFNAWHFVDANLWASLATKIFDEVSDTIAKNLGLSKKEQSIEKKRAEFRTEIESSRRQKVEANQELDSAIEARSQARETYEECRGKRFLAALKLGQQRWQQLEEKAKDDRELKKALRGARKAAERLGVDHVMATAEGLEALLEQLRHTRASVSNIWSTVIADIRNPASLILTLLAPAAVVLGIVFGYAFVKNPEEFTLAGTLTGNKEVLAQWGSVLASTFTWAITRLRSLSKGAEYVQSVIGRTKDLKLYSDEKLSKIDSSVHAARTRMQEAERRLAEYEQELQRINAGGLVYDFLESRRNHEAYLKYKGLISIVRDDFQHLEYALKKLQGENPIERIILYIDDLDRCRSDRVVQVLEALHLLLSFRLFVVIVAVDSRWLRNSLERSYRTLTGVSNESKLLQRGEQPFTAQNYLEKIFQIPFSLERMDREGFANLVDAVVEPQVKSDDTARTRGVQTQSQHKPDTADESDSPLQFRTPEDTTQVLGSTATRGQEGTATLFNLMAQLFKNIATRISRLGDRKQRQVPTVTESIQSESDTGASPKIAATESETASTLAEADSLISNEKQLEIIRLTDHERVFIHALHKFIKTPRQTKRFINVYRLLRPQPDTREFEHFAGSVEKLGYQAMLLLLAINTGYPAPAGRLLRLLAALPEPNGHLDKAAGWAEFLYTLSPANEKRPEWASIWGDLDAAQIRHTQELFDRLAFFQRNFKVRDEKTNRVFDFQMPTTMDVYQSYARCVGRYSFDWNMVLPDETETGLDFKAKLAENQDK